MQFTYRAYRELINLLKENGYRISDYGNYRESRKAVILRHDIDFSLEPAVKMARIEHEEGVYATWFVLVSTDFYNIHSKKVLQGLYRIKESGGGKIGLHFDETAYGNHANGEIIDHIIREKEILELTLGFPVSVVSMHRPSKSTLAADYQIPGMVNSYSSEFFRQFKYVSDSRMHWREDVKQIVASGEYDRLHILTHAFWYQEADMAAKEILKKFVNEAKQEQYARLDRNLSNLQEFLPEDDIW